MRVRFTLFGIDTSILPMRTAFLPILLLAFVSIPWHLRAQNSNGALQGVVQDSSGARVAGARVLAQAAGSSISRTATTNGQGDFRIEGLLPGRYRVIVTANRFRPGHGQCRCGRQHRARY